jgi:hypothetical protein
MEKSFKYPRLVVVVIAAITVFFASQLLRYRWTTTLSPFSRKTIRRGL